MGVKKSNNFNVKQEMDEELMIDTDGTMQNAIYPAENTVVFAENLPSTSGINKAGKIVKKSNNNKKLKNIKLMNALNLGEIPTAVGQIIKLYAYKDCLGKFDSLVNNLEIALWFRENNFLKLKYLRQKFDDDGLFFYSTNIYSCWECERSMEYVEINAVVVTKQTPNFVVKILELEQIENMCLEENFSSLGLTPYTNYLTNPQMIIDNSMDNSQDDLLEEIMTMDDDNNNNNSQEDITMDNSDTSLDVCTVVKGEPTETF